ncbi:unnamed protein product [Pseudo-nitzschia multistriata]|uniref:Gfo/Idh/MocA-like oxidoreductase N-terminal domain-containing protein n=1 Tax=Pseudo-nitzschia multistriata TaxID=183589 RepID=A0A448ZLN9_9STRA|nr:unnamed protein product [Pseudo-nitzschia multistriata]
MASTTKKASVMLVGCGQPKGPIKSMGAYHAIQILDDRVPDAELALVVEPWYMSEVARSMDPKPAGFDEFNAWKEEMETEKGIAFYATVSEVPPPGEDELRLAIISARTADNPALLEACVKSGCTAIFLEKPGATTVGELERMRGIAEAANVGVFMGFNKNVSSYLTKTRDFVEKSSKCDVTFLHNNNYKDTEEELSECFERNSEGMLKNMAIHELAICVTYYGVTVDTIAKVEADKEYSCLKTLGNFTDFVRLKFKLVTTDGVEISVAADRCGGDDSVGIVTDAETGKEMARFAMPDEDTIANIPSLQEKYGDAMPYFFTQDPDYLKLKELVVDAVVHGRPATGVADIGVAIETLKVAEHLTPILQEQLK